MWCHILATPAGSFNFFFVVHGGVLFTHFLLNLILNLINRWFRYLILGGLWCCLIPYNYQCFPQLQQLQCRAGGSRHDHRVHQSHHQAKCIFFRLKFQELVWSWSEKKPKSVQCVEDLITSFTILITLFTVKSEVWIRMAHVLFVRKRRRMKIWRGSSAPTSATNTPRDVAHKHVILQGTQLSKGTAGNTCHGTNNGSDLWGHDGAGHVVRVTFRCFPDRVFCYRLGRHRRSAWWSRHVKPTFLQAGAGCLPNVF